MLYNNNNNTPIVEHIITTYKLICICMFFLFIYDLLLAYIKAPPFEPDSPFAGFEIVGGNNINT
jgi:hypothetical protein